MKHLICEVYTKLQQNILTELSDLVSVWLKLQKTAIAEIHNLSYDLMSGSDITRLNAIL